MTSSNFRKSYDEIVLNTLAGGICTAFSVFTFHPLDTLRIRWQTRQKENKPTAVSLRKFAFNLVRSEGLISGLWRPGLTAHMSAVFVSSGVRLGFYPTFRDFLVRDGEKTVVSMWLAGLLAGAVGFWLSTPLFQSKIKIQTATSMTPSTLYRSLIKTYVEHGFTGLYKGSTILMIRGALLSAGAQLGYDGSKTFILRQNLSKDGPFLHLFSSISSAFCCSIAAAPADMVLTSYTAQQYKAGISRCVTHLIRQHGIGVLYRGWTLFFLRIAPLYALNMPLYEQLRRLIGLGYLD